MEYAIVALALLFFFGHVLQWFFAKTKIPDLLILTVLGYVIGPVMGLVSQEDLGQVGSLMATLALIVILYEAGLHLSTKDLAASWLPSLILSLLSFGMISAVVILVTGPIVGFTYSILIAFAVGSTSSAIVIPMVKFLSLDQKTKTVLSLESAFTDIFAIVFFLVALEAILKGHLDAGSVFFNIGPKTFISMGLGLSFALIWAAIKKYFPDSTDMQFSGEAWALLCYGVSQLLELNGAMSVLCLGFALANLNLLPKWFGRFFSPVPVTYANTQLLSEITFLLKTFFFLYLGMLISFSNVSLVLVGLVIVVGIFLTRYLAIRLMFPAKKCQLIDALALVSMGPRGLACAVLATLPIQAGIESGETIQQILFAVIPISIFLTAVFVFICENEIGRKKFQFLFPNHDNNPSTTTEPSP